MGASMTPFHVGMKVVCLCSEDPPELDDFPGDTPKVIVGQIYTISAIESNWEDTGFLMLEFEETYDGHPDGAWYDADNFRPIVKTDISIFTAMLAPSPKKRVGA